MSSYDTTSPLRQDFWRNRLTELNGKTEVSGYCVGIESGTDRNGAAGAIQAGRQIERFAIRKVYVEERRGWYAGSDKINRTCEGRCDRHGNAALLQGVFDRHCDQNAIFHNQHKRRLSLAW